jgi:hypothetical protein
VKCKYHAADEDGEDLFEAGVAEQGVEELEGLALGKEVDVIGHLEQDIEDDKMVGTDVFLSHDVLGRAAMGKDALHDCDFNTVKDSTASLATSKVASTIKLTSWSKCS